ncbi:uncharacterized protein LOC107489623 isoform X2 [Arachis duranensis]|uniref:Uncharacterized protein LOC107489623 isoform X2 n=1 Tax=Arachis duranensis TaxID=130453 RepID=A0A6P4DK78_ARADU|nr:uncharacterized protein LOC107489623 isoform X2 [Arachis duranensis]XP_025700379.1 uncharacterized protein LOC112801690 isoform X2 [Arachis hypogaea]
MMKRTPSKRILHTLSAKVRRMHHLEYLSHLLVMPIIPTVQLLLKVQVHLQIILRMILMTLIQEELLLDHINDWRKTILYLTFIFFLTAIIWFIEVLKW